MVECLWAFRHVGFFYCEVFKPEFQRKPLRKTSATNSPQVAGTIGGDSAARTGDAVTRAAAEMRENTTGDEALAIESQLRETSDGARVGENRHENEQRFGAIFRQTTAGIVQTDLAGRLCWRIHVFARSWAVRRAIAPPPNARHHAPRGPPDEPASFRPADGGRAGVHGGETLRSAGWIMLWVHNSVSLIRDQAGKPELRGRVHLGHHREERGRVGTAAAAGSGASGSQRIGRRRPTQG